MTMDANPELLLTRSFTERNVSKKRLAAHKGSIESWSQWAAARVMISLAVIAHHYRVGQAQKEQARTRLYLDLLDLYYQLTGRTGLGSDKGIGPFHRFVGICLPLIDPNLDIIRPGALRKLIGENTKGFAFGLHLMDIERLRIGRKKLPAKTRQEIEQGRDLAYEQHLQELERRADAEPPWNPAELVKDDSGNPLQPGSAEYGHRSRSNKM
jgi:hypothetical protein